MKVSCRFRTCLLVPLVFFCFFLHSHAISLKTRSVISSVRATELQRFLATTENWPKIVASSMAVETTTPSLPLTVGAKVDEVFGLPPLLPLRVCWRCEKNDESEGTLSVVSEKGLSGIARDCRMDFIIRDAEGGGSASVELTMTYTPSSPIALLAVPALILDNAFALKVLLPRVIAREREK